MTATPKCPRCSSTEIVSRNYASKTGGVIGAIAGAGAALSGADSSTTIGGVGGAVLKALIGVAAGCTTGAVMGRAIDDTILDNYECTRCELTFGKHDVSHPL